MKYGKTIKLFLIDGESGDLITHELYSWTYWYNMTYKYWRNNRKDRYFEIPPRNSNRQKYLAVPSEEYPLEALEIALKTIKDER